MTKEKPQELLLQDIISKGVLFLRIINHPLRQQILTFIHENQRITVTGIHKKFRIEQSVASEHLALLRKENFVMTERDGRFIFYSINYEALKKIQKLVEELVNKNNKTEELLSNPPA